jgi:hypothetical protein
MFEVLDKIVFRFEQTFYTFRNPHRNNDSFNEGKSWGEQIAFAKIRQQLKNHDPNQFDNQHFKLGYYYAAETAKKVMQDDDHNSVD